MRAHAPTGSPHADSGGLPPGPDLPAWVQTPLFGRDPIGVLSRTRARYGPVFTLKFASAGPTVVVAAPGEVAELLEGDPGTVHAGAARRAVLPQASSRSSFGADGNAHRAARARIADAMSAHRIGRLRGEIDAIVTDHVSAWPADRPFRVLSRMRTLCESIFVRLVLGVEGEADVRELAAAVGRALRTPGNPPLLPPDRDSGIPGSLVQAAVERRVTPVKSIIAAQVERYRRAPTDEPTILAATVREGKGRDAQEIADELIVVLAAAQEPPAIAGTWLLERLARTPGLADDYRNAPGASGLRRAIVDETLRLRPPALASLRTLQQPLVVGGYPLAPGTAVMVSIPLLHRDPTVFRNPLEFDPERFRDRATPPEFIPFGAGPRACPGENLARAAVDAVAEAVLDRFALRFLGRPERPVQRATVLVPNRSGLAIARRR